MKEATVGGICVERRGVVVVVDLFAILLNPSSITRHLSPCEVSCLDWTAGY